MNKILNFLLTPLIAILLIIIKIPDGNKPNTLLIDRYAHEPFIIYSLLIIGTIYNYFITVVSPYRALQKKKKEGWKGIDAAADAILKKYKEYNLSFNIMIPQRKLFCRLEPSIKKKGKQKITLFPKILKVIWNYGGHVHTNLIFTTKQGVVGKAFREEDWQVYDLKEERAKGTNLDEKFNLNPEQMRLTEKVTLVASCPILQTKQRSDSQTITILGVLTVDCKSDNGGVLVTNLSKRAEIYRIIAQMANLYSYWYS